LSDAALEKQIAYWKKELASPPAPLQLCATNAEIRSDESEVQEFKIENALFEKLRAFNTVKNTTSFMTLLAVYKILLAEWAGATDVSVGSPESGRRRFETETLQGCFVNML